MNTRSFFIIRRRQSTQEILRLAQTVEIFRTSYFKSSHSSSISISDIDDLVVSNKIRPSALVGIAETTGTSIGFLSKFLPQNCKADLDRSVNETSVQQLNDCIRSGRTNEGPDVIETLKYHRDLKVIENIESVHSSKSSDLSKDFFLKFIGLSRQF